MPQRSETRQRTCSQTWYARAQPSACSRNQTGNTRRAFAGCHADVPIALEMRDGNTKAALKKAKTRIARGAFPADDTAGARVRLSVASGTRTPGTSEAGNLPNRTIRLQKGRHIQSNCPRNWILPPILWRMYLMILSYHFSNSTGLESKTPEMAALNQSLEFLATLSKRKLRIQESIPSVRLLGNT
jgi:hypothetical protein